VIVKHGRVIAGDYHHQAGKPHAEALALAKAGDDAHGADLYVTLEPCCFHGRTPPCTEAIIKAGIKKVVVGAIDPNPAVNGKGIKRLNGAGIEIVSGVLQKECESVNRGYSKFITSGMPLVTVKYAQSLDGRIATKTGHSQWISSPESLEFAHQLRAAHDAILIGAKTANHDNPQLTVRLVKGKNPARIVLSASGGVKSNLRLFHDKQAPVIIATGRQGLKLFKRALPDIETIVIPAKNRGLDLKNLLKKMAEKRITSVLIEGGSGVITGFLKQNLVDRMIIIAAPIIIGEGISAVGDLNIRTIDQSRKLINIEYRKIGRDCAIIGDLA
jgi:diaminohydroxyphosphoribosylaminopyrimidine deaminase/5-amino-6-(5-phosphoribosylamino)uracil reductase